MGPVLKFGPAGLGPVKKAIETLKKYSEFGFKACEVEFTYGVYIKCKEDAEKIGKAAKKYGISLSIHAPYWINLNSKEESKIEQSKRRIIECLKVGTWLGATVVVFHPGYYGKFSKEETYKKIKKQILELQKIRKKEKYSPLLAPETTGKTNVFGSIEEIARLVKETRCYFCIDFAHILAREKSYKFKEVFSKFKQKKLHIHFSGIVYGEKGEKHHRKTSKIEMETLIKSIPSNRIATIINESPTPIEDSLLGIKVAKAIADKKNKKKKKILTI